MPILRIHHPVPDFDAWKKAFDDDPMGRERSGVRRHRVFQTVDDPNQAWIDLEFDTDNEAAAFRDRLEQLWRDVQNQGLIGAPTANILEEIEHQRYGAAPE